MFHLWWYFYGYLLSSGSGKGSKDSAVVASAAIAELVFLISGFLAVIHGWLMVLFAWRDVRVSYRGIPLDEVRNVRLERLERIVRQVRGYERHGESLAKNERGTEFKWDMEWAVTIALEKDHYCIL
jgi:hypothetical protein